MDKIKKLFTEKHYEAVIAEIQRDFDYKNNRLKLRYLVSAFYYSRDYKGTINAIQLLKPLEEKAAFSMLINTEICLGSNADAALGYIDQYLGQDLTIAEKNWAHFQKGLCFLAKGRRSEAIELFIGAGSLENETMEAERHFFLNNAKNMHQSAANENEKINELIIEARMTANTALAKEALRRAAIAKYGEAEYFARVVLAKYMQIPEEKLALAKTFGDVEGTLYYRII